MDSIYVCEVYRCDQCIDIKNLTETYSNVLYGHVQVNPERRKYPPLKFVGKHTSVYGELYIYVYHTYIHTTGDKDDKYKEIIK